MFVGREHKLAASLQKALRLSLTKELMRTRLPCALLLAHWSAPSSAADPGIAVDTNRNFPRYCIHFFPLTLLTFDRLSKMSASVSLQWGGNSSVCQRVSMIQSKTSFRVAQLPSACGSFFSDTASFRCRSEMLGCDSTWSMASSSCVRRALNRFLLPWPTWMKSSTKTSLALTGHCKGSLDGWLTGSSAGSSGGSPAKSRKRRVALSSSCPRGSGSFE